MWIERSQKNGCERISITVSARSPLDVPPLRQRREEVEILLRYSMHKLARYYGLPPREFSPSVAGRLPESLLAGKSERTRDIRQTLPGRRRQTTQLERIRTKFPEQLATSLTGRTTISLCPARTRCEPEEVEASADASIPKSLKSLIQSVKWETERNAIAVALEKTGWNRKAAARLLGVSYRTMLYKIDQYHMSASELLRPSRTNEVGRCGSDQRKRKSKLSQDANCMGEKRQGAAMTTRAGSFWRTGLLAASCLLLSNGLWAQAPSSNAAQPSQNADASTAPKPHDDSFVIGNDDVLAINVWKEPDISRSIPVRSDGKISLPLVGEVQAAGRTPLKLEVEIASRLKNYISEPEVTVIVQQINSQKFNILGQVNRPGTYVIANSPTVLDAIALAGGFRDFAKQKSIYVLRQNADGSQTRIPFNYKEVVKGQNPAQNIKVQPRDTIVVP